MHMPKRSTKVIAVFAVVTTLTAMQSASAKTPIWLPGWTINGFAAAYDWASINNQFSSDNQYTLTEGGGLFIGSPSYHGLSFAVEPIFQTGLGLHSNNPNAVSRTLGPDVGAFGQAYVEYHGYGLTVKGGDFITSSSPWSSSSVGIRLLPITFQGVHVKFRASRHLRVYASRVVRYRYLNESRYNAGTIYTTYLPALSGRTSSGYMSAGLNYERKVPSIDGLDTKNSLWAWDYYQYARLYLAQTVDSVNLGHAKGIIGLQVMDAKKQRGYLGRVNSQLYGAELGAAYKSFKLVLGEDYLPPHPNSFNYGGLATPYNTITDSGPIFSQPITDSTEDYGSGSAFSVHVDYLGVPGLFTQIRFVNLHMRTTPVYSNYREVSLLVSYKLKAVKGLSITNIANYATDGAYAQSSGFFQNRIMLVYSF